MLYQQFYSNCHLLLGSLAALKPFSTLAVAVSGGVDSVALLTLLDRVVRQYSLNLVVMTVNHHLRPASEVECQYVQDFSRSLGHQCIILHWDSQNNCANLQARARAGRYLLMTDQCLKLGILTLITAHHADDQLENFWLKQQRRSSVFGLSASNINYYNNVRILRLLFNIDKRQLIDHLTNNNIKWFEDESNHSSYYQRSKLRLLLNHNDHLKQRTRFWQQQVDQQAAELQPLLIEAIATSVIISQLGFASINLQNFQQFLPEIRLQLINFVLTIIGGKRAVPRFRSIAPVLRDLENGCFKTTTLHGCIIQPGDQLTIYREFGRQLPPPVVAAQDVKWDQRFRLVESINFLSDQAYITNLTAGDYLKIKNYLNRQIFANLPVNHRKAILFTLPVIKILEKIISIPHISYYSDQAVIDQFKFSFWPSFTSRFTHFY